MCILKNKFNLHITEHDKIDLLTVGVTLTDFCWLVGDMVFAGVHIHHYFIFSLLLLLSIASVFAIIRMCKRHSKAKLRRLGEAKRLAYELAHEARAKHSER